MSDALYQLLDEWKGGSSLGDLCGGGGSPAAGFIQRMMAENRLKNKGKYGKSTELPKGSKMDTPTKFKLSKMKKPSEFVKTHFKESKNPLYNKGKLYTPPNYRSKVPTEPFKLDRSKKGKSAKSLKGGVGTDPSLPLEWYDDEYGNSWYLDEYGWHEFQNIDPSTTKGWYVDKDNVAWYDGVKYGQNAVWQQYIDKNVAPNPLERFDLRDLSFHDKPTILPPGPPGRKELGPAPPAPIDPAPTDYSYIPKGYAYGLPPLNPGWVLDKTDDSLWYYGTRFGHISDKDVSQGAIYNGPSNEWGIFEMSEIPTDSSGAPLSGYDEYLDYAASTTRTLPNGQRITAPIDPYVPGAKKEEMTTTAEGVKGKVKTYQFNPGWVLDQWDNGLWKDGVYKGKFKQFKEEAVVEPPPTQWQLDQWAKTEKQDAKDEAQYYREKDREDARNSYSFFDSLGRIVKDIYSFGSGVSSTWDYGTGAYIALATGNPLPLLGTLVFDAAGEIIPDLIGFGSNSGGAKPKRQPNPTPEPAPTPTPSHNKHQGKRCYFGE